MFRGDASENILCFLKHLCILLHYYEKPWLNFSLKLLQTNTRSRSVQKTNTLKLISYNWKKREAASLHFWNGWLGCLIRHMDMKLRWQFASQVSLLFKPKERKGNWHWWRRQIARWQLEAANTLFLVSGQQSVTKSLHWHVGEVHPRWHADEYRAHFVGSPKFPWYTQRRQI